MTIIRILEEVSHVLDILNKAGFSAYIVGGCVRDSLLKNEPKDWDVASNAKPEEVRKIFEVTKDTGLKYGTITVIIEKTHIEVTTYRIEERYTDRRRPDSVTFTDDLKQDLSRRDFTMNAMAYHPKSGLFDPFKGTGDIKDRIIRAVGDPCERFEEDALRMLRCIRFAVQLRFDIDEGTFDAAKTLCAHASILSAERVSIELTKILMSDNPTKGFVLLEESGLLKYILPEFHECFNTPQNNPYHEFNVAMHCLVSVSNIEKNKILRWTMLLHDIGKAVTRTTDSKDIDHFHGHAEKSVVIAKKVLTSLKFDKKSIEKILKLIKHHDLRGEPSEKLVRRFMNRLGDDFCRFLKVQRADLVAHNPQYLARGLERLAALEEIYTDIKKRGDCIHLNGLAVNGDDLIAVGFEEGEEIRETLEKLLEVVIDRPEMNEKEKLLTWIQEK